MRPRKRKYSIAKSAQETAAELAAGEKTSKKQRKAPAGLGLTLPHPHSTHTAHARRQLPQNGAATYTAARNRKVHQTSAIKFFCAT